MKPRFAVCLDNSAYPVSLELHKIYRVLPDEDAERDGDIRIVDESGEDYLYPAKNFALIAVLESSFRMGSHCWGSQSRVGGTPSSQSVITVPFGEWEKSPRL